MFEEEDLIKLLKEPINTKDEDQYEISVLSNYEDYLVSE